VNIWWLAALPSLVAGLFTILPKIDPRKRDHEKFRGFCDAFCLFTMIFLGKPVV